MWGMLSVRSCCRVRTAAEPWDGEEELCSRSWLKTDGCSTGSHSGALTHEHGQVSASCRAQDPSYNLKVLYLLSAIIRYCYCPFQLLYITNFLKMFLVLFPSDSSGGCFSGFLRKSW